MFVVEIFISVLIKIYGKRPISIEGGTWYPQDCKFLKLEHHFNSSFEKSMLEMTGMQYTKYRTESFDDCFPCKGNSS